MIRKVIAGLLFTVTPSFGWDVGFNFRATSGFVTDPSYAVFASFATTNYPTTATIGGVPVTFGWETVGITQVRDRSMALDPRLAGMNCQLNNGGFSVFRVDLPSNGVYNIGLAAGDPAGYTDSNNIGIDSGNDNLFSVQAITGATSNTDIADATGTLLSIGSWATSNRLVTRTFATSILRLKLGGSVDNSYSCGRCPSLS